MNEIEQVEKELKALRPKGPSADFERRVEEALGDSARLAVRQLPEPGDEPEAQTAPANRGNLFLIPSLLLLGAAALVARCGPTNDAEMCYSPLHHCAKKEEMINYLQLI